MPRTVGWVSVMPSAETSVPRAQAAVLMARGEPDDTTGDKSVRNRDSRASPVEGRIGEAVMENRESAGSTGDEIAQANTASCSVRRRSTLTVEREGEGAAAHEERSSPEAWTA